MLAGKPDGYTIGVYIADTLATIPTGLARHGPEDFEWIVRTQVADSFLFVTLAVSAVNQLLSAVMVLWPIWKARRA